MFNAYHSLFQITCMALLYLSGLPLQYAVQLALSIDKKLGKVFQAAALYDISLSPNRQDSNNSMHSDTPQFESDSQKSDVFPTNNACLDSDKEVYPLAENKADCNILIKNDIETVSHSSNIPIHDMVSADEKAQQAEGISLEDIDLGYEMNVADDISATSCNKDLSGAIISNRAQSCSHNLIQEGCDRVNKNVNILEDMFPKYTKLSVATGSNTSTDSEKLDNEQSVDIDLSNLNIEVLNSVEGLLEQSIPELRLSESPFMNSHYKYACYVSGSSAKTSEFVDTKSIAQYQYYKPQIVFLDVSNMYSHTDDLVLVCLKVFFQANSSIKKVIFRSKQINDRMLNAVIEHATDLREISLHCDSLTTAAIAAMGTKCKTLQNLDIRGEYL